MLLGDAPAIGPASSRAAATVATVTRSATAVAAATCSGIVRSLEFGAAAKVGRESEVSGPVVPELAVALFFRSSCALGEGGGSGTRVAGASALAAMMAGFAFLVARWALSRGR